MEIFPLEIWEKILEPFKHSKEIINVVRAFPKLAILCPYSTKIQWIFEEVLPFLVSNFINKKVIYKREKYCTVSQKQLLKLRLVCKGWKLAVDQVLTNNSQFNFPYESHFSLGRSIFRSSEQIEKFMNDMSQYKGNPFPGKSVLMKPNKSLFLICDQLIKSSVNLFEKFGLNIFCLEIDVRDNFSSCHLEMCKNILKCLHYLPNLRSLTLTGYLDSCVHRKTNIYFENAISQILFPDLPNLKRFECNIKFYHSDNSNWLGRLIETYAKGSSKLFLSVRTFWQPSLALSLSYLTELKLLLESDLTVPLMQIKKILIDVSRCNKLQKLSLTSINNHCSMHILKIISLLNIFLIENVALENMVLGEQPIFDQRLLHVNNYITSLYLEDSVKLSYEFMGWLPSLCHLTIFMNSTAYKAALKASQLKIGNNSLGYCLRTYLLKAFHSELVVPRNFCLWQWYPQLKTFTGIIEVRNQDLSALLDVKFVRECENKAILGGQPNENEIEEEVANNQGDRMDESLDQMQEISELSSESEDYIADNLDKHAIQYDIEEFEETCDTFPLGWRERLPGKKEEESDSEIFLDESKDSWCVWYDDLREDIQSEKSTEECFWPKEGNESSEDEDTWENVKDSTTDSDSSKDEDLMEMEEDDLIKDEDEMEKI